MGQPTGGTKPLSRAEQYEAVPGAAEARQKAAKEAEIQAKKAEEARREEILGVRNLIETGLETLDKYCHPSDPTNLCKFESRGHEEGKIGTFTMTENCMDRVVEESCIFKSDHIGDTSLDWSKAKDGSRSWSQKVECDADREAVVEIAFFDQMTNGKMDTDFEIKVAPGELGLYLTARSRELYLGLCGQIPEE